MSQLPNCQWRHLLGLLCLFQLSSTIYSGYLEDNYPASVLEDAHMTTLQLLAKYKYPGEAHGVTTEDNYQLQMHRIARPGAKPVLLVHGLFDSSAAWILMGPHSGLGYFLYDAGYDVWLGNVRGNRYSRGHTKLNPNTDKAYWSFSWHEIGMYDLPAMIDAVLAKTGRQKLSYFGHSQGTTSFFVMASMRPEYNAKIHIMQAIAPVAYMTHMKAPMLGVARTTINMMGDHVELLPHSNIMFKSCTSSATSLQTCIFSIGQFLGKNVAEINKTAVPIMLGHLPAGCNSKQPHHYIQLQKSEHFCPFDYEAQENQRIYGRATPPDYPIERITAPVGLYYAHNDFMAAVEDVQRLAKRLSNVVENHLYPYKKWNHIDMIWGISSRRLAQPRMLQVMQFWEAEGTRNIRDMPTEQAEEAVPQNKNEDVDE